MQPVEIYRGKTVEVPVSLGFNVSQDVITSDIRVDQDPTSALIASWNVSFATDGTDGELILKLDASITAGITQSIGYMDLKRVTGESALSIFNEALEVSFMD